MTIALIGTLSISFIFAQDRAPLTLNQVSDLLKQGISSSRIAQLVEQYGVAFELNDAASKRLRQDGADEVVLSAVKRMAARYTEEQQRRKTEEAKRREQEEAQRRAERKKQEEVRQEQAKQREAEKKGTKKPEETTQSVEDIRKRLEEARRREEEKRIKEEQKRQPPA